MDVSVSLEDVLEKAAPAASPAAGGRGEAALPGDSEKTEETEMPAGTDSVSGGNPGIPDGSGAVVVYAEDPGTVPMLESIYECLEAMGLQMEERTAGQIQVLQDQTGYTRDGNMITSILLGFIAGILLFVALKGRR